MEVIQTGKTPPSGQNEYFVPQVNWFNPSDIGSQKELRNSNRKVSNKAIDDRKAVLFPSESVLLTCIGDIGRAGIIREPSSSNQQITCLKPDSTLFVDFLYYWLVRNKEQLEFYSNNAVVPILNNAALKKIKISLPPLPIQQKIADVLDTADRIRRRNQQILEKYDQLAQSVFLEMFGDPVKNEKGWEETKVEAISKKVTDGDHATPKRSQSGYKLLSCRNVKNGYIDFEPGVDYVDEDEFQRMFKRCNPEKGDILISCSGTIGRTTSVKIDEPFVLVRSAALIKPKKEIINSEYLEHYFRTGYMQAIMLRNANTSSQSNLFTGPIKKLPVQIPPLALQNQFAYIIEKIEHQKQLAKAELDKSEELFQSLMQGAFKGGAGILIM